MTSKNSQERLWLSPCLHMAVLVLVLIGVKLLSLETVSRTYLDCQWCLTPKSLTHEAEFLLLLLAVHLLSSVSRLRLWRVVLRLAVVLAVLITTVDLMIAREFWVRFIASDFFKFAGEFGALKGYLLEKLSDPWVLTGAAVATLLVITVFVRYLKENTPSLQPVFLYFLIALGVAGCEMVETNEYHDIYLRNSVEVFFSRQTNNTPYSKDFVKTIAGLPGAEQRCNKASSVRTDVILLVFESLSMYHSALFSGINDWMPEFDAVSKTGVHFSNFYANGVTSEQGLVALLTGEPPIAKGMETKSLFEQFRNPVQSVPRMLHGLGYDTVFLTTGNLGFVGKGKWLKDIGFDMVEGHDAPAYKGLKRYQFDAASDDALYARALAELKLHKTKPTFMTLETVTTHLPNVDPATGAHSQELTYRYADRQLGDFVRKLHAAGFFDHGTLIITADHRAMVPMGAREHALYGDRGYARVPLTVVGSGLVGREESAAFSQTDLLPSLRNAAASGLQCASANQGVFLPTVVRAPKCIYTNRSYDTNGVFVHCGAEDIAIELNGDQTHFAEAQTQSPDVLQELHSLRLGKGFR